MSPSTATPESAINPTAAEMENGISLNHSSNTPPTAAFGAMVNNANTTLQVDASASSDAEGSLASFAWDFGDGNSATGATATHNYANDGTYTVDLKGYADVKLNVEYRYTKRVSAFVRLNNMVGGRYQQRVNYRLQTFNAMMCATDSF